jgi:hypothetical protein
MDIKELNKTQLILLTLLITFVVSIATGIVTVSLMQQMPKSVPQTINNVIQRTIEKVTTVQAPATSTDNTAKSNKDTPSLLGDGDVIVSIYARDTVTTDITAPVSNASSTTTPSPTDNASSAAPSSTVPSDTNKTTDTTTPAKEPKALGQGIIISDVGLILVDSSILTDKETYKVILNKTDFDATILKKFSNGFSILKITPKTEAAPVASEGSKSDKSATKSTVAIPAKDLSASAVDSTQ